MKLKAHGIRSEAIKSRAVRVAAATALLALLPLVSGMVEATPDTATNVASSAESGASWLDFQPIKGDGTELILVDPVQVVATVETEPVPNDRDAADDPAIWVHPTDPSQSLVLGTDKKGGLAVYSLAGEELQYLPDGEINNVDIRYRFPLGAAEVTLIVASNLGNDTIAIYTIDPATREVRAIASRVIEVGIRDAYGLCLYHSPKSGDYFAFVTDQKGRVEQWRLFDDGAGKVDAELVRDFAVGSQSEGCVADEELGALYISEENVALWKYDAEPDGGDKRVEVDLVGAGSTGNLTADIEGLAIYYARDGAGYLIVSNQGDHSFALYERQGDNAYLGTFEIDDSAGVDNVTNTDGIDVTNVPLGAAFPFGLFVAQDNNNEGENQNFKFVPWQAIAEALNLQIDTHWRP